MRQLPEASECLECGGRMTARPEVVDFHALPGVKLVGVPVYRCDDPECGEVEVEIPQLPKLLDLLAKMVAGKEGRLRPVEFRFLRKHLGLSQADVANWLLCSTANETVSRWEAGKQPIQPAAEQAMRLRVLLGEYKPNYHVQEMRTTDSGATIPLLSFDDGGWKPGGHAVKA